MTFNELKEIKDDLNIINFYTSYDHLFEYKIIFRGIDYSKRGKVDLISHDDKKISATVHGTNDYHVEILFKNNSIDVKCECPYHIDTNKYCKHVYAALIDSDYKEAMKSMSKEYTKYINKSKSIIKKVDTFLEVYPDEDLLIERDKLKIEISKYEYKNKNSYELFYGATKSIITSTNFLIFEYNNALYRVKRQKFDYIDEIIYYLETYIEDNEVYEDEEFDDYEDVIELDEEIQEIKKANARYARRELIRGIFSLLLLPGKILFFFLSFLGGLNSGYESSKRKNDFNLMPWEQDLVNRGEYEPYHFEEDEMEEDDYYYEDD